MKTKYLVGPVTLNCKSQGFTTLMPVWAEVIVEAGDIETPDLVEILSIGTTVDIIFEEDDCADIIYYPSEGVDRREAFMNAFGTDGCPSFHVDLAFRQGYAKKVKI